MTRTAEPTRAARSWYRLPRAVHPAAWWLWALGMAVAAGRTTNPVLLAMVLAVVAFVVVNRRGDAPWAFAFRLYAYLGLVIVVMRVLFRILLGGPQGEHVLVVLPEIPLPDVAAGIQLLGPFTLEELLGGFYDGLRLATMLICVGAANALANPKRMLKSLPAALYEVGAAVVVALSVAPQLAESVLRVRRARRLRGGGQRGMRALRGIVIPVLSDAMDRSLALAAAMDVRGYGRSGDAPPALRRATGALVVVGLLGVCVGVYGLMDGTTRTLGAPLLLAGLALAGTGFLLGGRTVAKSSYRPDRWRVVDVAVAACGVTAAAVLYLTSSVDAANLYPSLSPLRWPQLAALPACGVLIGLLPAWIAPPPPSTAEVPR
ncbi:CbiQ family ECF transporter T component [Umezawaea endophytica]|uniref:Energy-coupling factor transporter transmembrane protein EcfT n=1 Tax=Umezawaea endophytica TaxID=1654476 RepID=A0A9X2VI64_9PSEU|nr:CbiQ family ECF transporter T component [Umezawaea endophytica]MCS7475463.1 energy-coupling factor transporter transmembrane protein EcfT [Umezawaea endophytica]